MKLKFRTNDFTIDDLVLSVEEPTKDEWLAFVDMEKNQDLEGRLAFILSKLRSIKNFKSSDDKELSVEDLKKVEIPYFLMGQIVRTYTATLFNEITKDFISKTEKTEKNDESRTA